MKVIIPLLARWDSIDAADQYEAQVRGLGRKFLSAVDDAIGRIAAQPHLYSPAPGAPAGREVRFRLVKRFPYVIYYEVLAAEIVILAITHARRSQRVWRRRL